MTSLVTPSCSGTFVPGTVLLLLLPSQPVSTPAAATARAAIPAPLRKRRREILSSLIMINLHIFSEVPPLIFFLFWECGTSFRFIIPPPRLCLSRAFSAFINFISSLKKQRPSGRYLHLQGRRRAGRGHRAGAGPAHAEGAWMEEQISCNSKKHPQRRFPMIWKRAAGVSLFKNALYRAVSIMQGSSQFSQLAFLPSSQPQTLSAFHLPA